MKILYSLIPSFITLNWLLWYSTQAKWYEVIVPNFLWMITLTTITTLLLWLGINSRKQNIKKIITTPEKPIAKEIMTWTTKTVIRERSIYEKPK